MLWKNNYIKGCKKEKKKKNSTKYLKVSRTIPFFTVMKDLVLWFFFFKYRNALIVTVKFSSNSRLICRMQHQVSVMNLPNTKYFMWVQCFRKLFFSYCTNVSLGELSWNVSMVPKVSNSSSFLGNLSLGNF